MSVFLYTMLCAEERGILSTFILLYVFYVCGDILFRFIREFILIFIFFEIMFMAIVRSTVTYGCEI